MFILRNYQTSLIEAARDQLRRHRSVLICAATGSGKTALAAYMIARAAERSKRAWMLVHRDFLLTQTARAFDQVGVEYGIIAAGYPTNPYLPIQIALINTLQRRLARHLPPDLLIVDEAHHLAARTWTQVYEWAATAKIVGLSATPLRLDGLGLDAYFDEMVQGPSSAWLMEQGYLSRYRCFAPSTPDVSGVHRRAGDYVTAELAPIMDTTEIAGNIVEQYKAKAAGKRAIYYGVSISHSQHIAAAFQAHGIAALHLDASDDGAARERAARALAGGSISVVANCELFGEGFDLDAIAPGATVEAVGLCRPTQSLALHLQQIGRSLRPKPEPAIILDHAGNTMRHGLPDDERTWSLHGQDKKVAREAAPPPIRMCMSCYAVFSAARLACPECGAVVQRSPREVMEIQADLVEADRELIRAVKAREVQRAKTREDLLRIAAARGYRTGWVDNVLAARTNRQPRQPRQDSAYQPSMKLRDDLQASLEEAV